jgi:putative SOS response-associated peptidase YedK
MCGRFALGIPRKKLAEHYGMASVPDAPMRYNIAPSQLVEAVIRERETGARGMRLFRWGLLPFWARDVKMAAKLINARCETAAEKPAFKAAMKYRRCLIPATGFYEWMTGAGGKTPYYFHLGDEDVFSLAGLWEHHESPLGEVRMTCAILTRQANAVVAPIHERMPVIVSPEGYDDWLNPHQSDPRELESFFRQPGPALFCREVGKNVNNPGMDDPSLIEPA